MSKNNNERHPNWYKDIEDMEVLILGSFPPHFTKWYYEFYYPNIANRFWKILRDISGLPLTQYKNEPNTDYKGKAVLERYAIMQKLKVGVQNMGKVISREGKSAKDTKIKMEEYHDILSIIRTHKDTLSTILLSGFHAKHSTYRSFITYLEQNGIIVPADDKPFVGKKFAIKVDDREINCIVLNSTSSASSVKYEILLNQFKQYVKLT